MLLTLDTIPKGEIAFVSPSPSFPACLRVPISSFASPHVFGGKQLLVQSVTITVGYCMAGTALLPQPKILQRFKS